MVTKWCASACMCVRAYTHTNKGVRNKGWKKEESNMVGERGGRQTHREIHMLKIIRDMYLE